MTTAPSNEAVASAVRPHRPGRPQRLRVDRLLHQLSDAGSWTGARIGQTPRLSQPALLRLFFKVAGIWGLSDAEQQVLLGGISRGTLAVWRSGLWGKVPIDIQDRICQLLHIHCTLLDRSGEAGAVAWLRRGKSCETFAGKTPIERLLSGRLCDLLVIRQYLDAGQCRTCGTSQRQPESGDGV